MKASRSSIIIRTKVIWPGISRESRGLLYHFLFPTNCFKIEPWQLIFLHVSLEQSPSEIRQLNRHGDEVSELLSSERLHVRWAVPVLLLASTQLRQTSCHEVLHTSRRLQEARPIHATMRFICILGAKMDWSPERLYSSHISGVNVQIYHYCLDHFRSPLLVVIMPILSLLLLAWMNRFFKS